MKKYKVTGYIAKGIVGSCIVAAFDERDAILVARKYCKITGAFKVEVVS